MSKQKVQNVYKYAKNPTVQAEFGYVIKIDSKFWLHGLALKRPKNLRPFMALKQLQHYISRDHI